MVSIQSLEQLLDSLKDICLPGARNNFKSVQTERKTEFISNPVGNSPVTFKFLLKKDTHIQYFFLLYPRQKWLPLFLVMTPSAIHVGQTLCTAIKAGLKRMRDECLTCGSQEGFFAVELLSTHRAIGHSYNLILLGKTSLVNAPLAAVLDDVKV